jgi:site-specific DNA recombinase
MTSADTLTRTTGRELIRVSHDKSGKLVSHDDQHFENEADAAALGVTLGQPYQEAGAASGSRYGHKARAASYGALCDDLNNGTFAGDYLWLWAVDRGSRQTSQWLALMESLERAGVLLRVTSEQRTYNMANPRDRKSLRDAASDAESKADDISVTVSRAARRDARNGHPHGKIVYGYTREYAVIGKADPVPDGWYRLASDKTKIARQVPHPDEAPVVKLITERRIAGHSWRAIAAELGAPWTASRARDVAANPLYCGKRLHSPGHQGGHLPAFELSALPDGNWTPLVSLADFRAVRKTLGKAAPPGRGRGRSARHLLSMIVRCGACGGPCSVRFTHSGTVARYTCHSKSCVTVDRDEVDDLVTDLVITMLSRPGSYATLTAGENDHGPELVAARDELDAARESHKALVDFMSDDKISVAAFAAAEPAKLARVDAAAKKVAALETPADVATLGLQPGQDIAARWAVATLTARRAVIRLLIDIVIMPAGRGSRAPVSERIKITRR